MKEQIIQIPDTFEVKEIKDGKIILVEKEKKLTYEDIADKIFSDGEYHYFINDYGDIVKTRNLPSNYKLSNNALSKKQLEKLLAINKLMNVAKYLNGDWQPDWSDTLDRKWFIYFSNDYGKLKIDCVHSTQQHFTYFNTKELAKQAIEILGEETIKLALCTDY